MSSLPLPAERSTGTRRFSLGRIVYSGTATSRLRTEEVLTALRRHGRGDWGDLPPEDAIANDLPWSKAAVCFPLMAWAGSASGLSPRPTVR